MVINCPVFAACNNATLISIHDLWKQKSFLSLWGLNISGTRMSSRERAKMGDILATEADLLGMIKEVPHFCSTHFVGINKVLLNLNWCDLEFYCKLLVLHKICRHILYVVCPTCEFIWTLFLFLFFFGSTLTSKNLKRLFKLLTRNAKPKGSLCRSLVVVLSETQRPVSSRYMIQ